MRIVAANPGLLARTAELFKRQRPVVEALLEGGSVEASRTDLEAIDREILAEFNVKVR